MKKILLLVPLFLFQLGWAQKTTVASPPAMKTAQTNTVQETIYTTDEVTIKPQFNGGTEALNTFIKRNFKKPKVKGLKGDVLVSFVVEPDGKLTEIGVLAEAGHGTGDEAIRVMERSPNWIPGSLNGNLVRTQYLLIIPILVN
jgi:periplasmic protein TonB